VRFPCATHLVVCCRSEAEAQKALAEVAAWTQAAGLKLHPTKTRIVSAEGKGGFDFLGYHFECYHHDSGLKWPRDKSRQKLRDKLRAKLPRGRSGSIPDILKEINPILKGWLGYFKYSATNELHITDAWVRGRIRHILRRRQKRRGMAKGRENPEYKNQWFEEQGFYSLAKAQAKWIQSLAGNH
jgi:RNA-directed DNA polymerase